MARCPTCSYPIPDDRERVGARCPSCHDPLYEPAGRVARPAREGEAACTLHDDMESVGVCRRCGGHVCETCRTRWRGQVLCAGCVEKALTTSEAISPQIQEQRRSALASLAFGGAAWLLAIVAVVIMLRFGQPGSRAAVVTTFFGLLTLAANALLAAVGLGHALAALRGRTFRGLALAGMAVSGLYVGVVLGLGALALWQS